MERLKGKVALVTGANSGIGAATAALFAREGAAVVLFARQEDNLREVAERIGESGGTALAVSGDVTSVDDCRRAFAETVRVLGRVDILVNNAGIVDFHRPTVKVTDELWHRIVAVDQTGVFLFCREALGHMTRAGAGAIVNVSSIAGVYGNCGAAYSAAKAAVIGLTRNIAMQYAGTGIRCNAVCPGPTPTALNAPDQLVFFDKDFMAVSARHTDMSVGPSDPLDQAWAILFLAGDEAGCITGQVLVVDRGMCL